MIKKIIVPFLLFSLTIYGQKIITEVKFTKDKTPLKFTYLPNLDKLVIQSGLKTNKKYGDIIKDINSYDTDGFVEKICNDEQLVNCIFSPIENAFLVGKLPLEDTFPQEYKLVLDGTSSKYFKLNYSFRYFNDIYGFTLNNQKNETKIDLSNDDIFLNVYDIFSNKVEKYKLIKPDLFRLNNKTTTFSEGNNFDIRINESNVGIVTKSIVKNYKSSTIYRTLYGLTGEKLDDISYVVSNPLHFLIYSNNGGGLIDYSNDEVKISDLCINNFVVDKQSQDVYIYGLYGKEGKMSNFLKNEPLGIYIFKFDKSGKKIWESNYDIQDLTGFNKSQELNNVFLNLRLRNNEAVVSVSNLQGKGYLDYITLATNNGEKLANGNIQVKGINANSDVFITATIEVASFPNIVMDKETVMASDLNSTLAKYLKESKNKNTLYYKTFLGKKGFWVIESDNLTYYKILLFV